MILVGGIGVTSAGCVTTEKVRHANLSKDSGTCVDFGTSYGSAAYSKCMLVQQRRRDAEMRNALEQAHLSTEIAKANMEMADADYVHHASGSIGKSGFHGAERRHC